MHTKSIFTAIFILFAVAAGSFLTSCTADITAELKEDGSVEFSSGSFGDGIKNMLQAASGEEIFIDTKEIIYELTKSGFTNVKAQSKSNSFITISMKDAKKNSYLFTSGILNIKKTNRNQQTLSVKLTPENLVKFYSTADEEITSLLDLLLAPVFNSEKMTAAEYEETIAAFYGEQAAEEIKNGKVNICIKTAGLTPKTAGISISELLTLSDNITLE